MRLAGKVVISSIVVLLAGLTLAPFASVPAGADNAPQAAPAAPLKKPSIPHPKIPDLPLSKPSPTPPPTSDKFRLVVTSSASDWQAYRFDSATGQAWKPQSADNSATWHWQPLVETTGLALGDYDVQVAAFVKDNTPKRHVLRLERKSGIAWGLNDTTWSEFSGGGAIQSKVQSLGKLRQSSTAQLGKSNPTATDAGFRIMAAASATGWNGYLLNPLTGDTWVAVAHTPPAGAVSTDDTWIWNRIQDSPQPPPGDYQLNVVTFLKNGAGVELTLRLDRSTGRCWQVTGSRWELLGEQADPAQQSPAKASFQLVLTSTSQSWNAYRFNPASGETWSPATENSVTAWQKYAESEHLPASDYDLQLVSWISDQGPQCRSFRLDRKTGRGWHELNGTWAVMGEQADFANGAIPRSGYRLVTTSSQLQWNVLRLNPQTGETWWQNPDSADWTWERLADAAQLPAGDYDLQAVSYVENNEGDVHFFRFDRKTGRSWSYYDSVWNEIAEQPDFAAADAAPFRLLTTGSGTGSGALRYSPSTGQSWWLGVQGNRYLWQSMPDAAALPAGNYTVQLVAFLDSKNKTTCAALRMNPSSGRTWVMINAAWVEITEPK